MVRPRFIPSALRRENSARSRRPHALWITSCGAILLCGGCALAPRSQVDECHQLSRTLRSENARLKDQLLVVQAQNRDYADRAVDDSRRLAAQDEAVERLEGSVQAYQGERGQLEAAYHELASSLGETKAQADARLRPASAALTTKDKHRSPSTSGNGDDGGDRDGEGTRQ
jgi:hypothetical protein